MIYTSYFSNVKYLAGKHPRMVFVSIAGKTPDWFDRSIIKIEKYGKLAPKWSWWHVWKEKFKDNPESDESKKWYGDIYQQTVLAELSQIGVYKDLMDISNHCDVCLLCWEAPIKFCHRHIVADWLKAGSIQCAEAENKYDAN